MKNIKQSEISFWDFKYKNQKNKYNPNRDYYFHHNFKQPMINLSKPAKILEIACGTRVDGIELSLIGHKLTETDISKQAVEKAKQMFESQNLTAEFIQADVDNLPFSNNTFDAVFTAASFHHFPNPNKSLSEIRRVTKHNGFIILGVEPNSWPYYTIYLILKPLKWIIRKINPRPFNSVADDECWGFTKNKLKKLFRQANIKIISIQRVKYAQEFYEQYLRLLSRLKHYKIIPKQNILKKLAKIDKFLSKIPLINLSNWHWNIIGKK